MKTQELQLLYIFDAIMTERSVTRAADRLAMTQPAVSNAISRMRQIWNDPLFVRKGRNIEPTSYALSLWDQVGHHMFALTNAVSATQFDPSTSNRTFRVAVTDVIVEMIWRQLVQMLESEAPGVDVHAVPYTPEGTHADLREAHVDVAVGVLSQHDYSLRSTWLFEGGYVLAMRADHPLAGRQITMEEFLEARHLLVSMSGDAHGFVDSYLDQKGMSRRIAATVNHFSTVPAVLRETNLIAAVPELISQDCGFVNGLWMGELPFDVDPTSLYLIWHARHDRDPGVVWLREKMENLLQERWHDIMANSPCGRHQLKAV
ncbi:LysR family transcriptional regulator [Marinobacter salsuginis]|uniref:LysR family transcriptional regulator n=1 Tax=Marinobacter salsuginis TaxID=418719 RepID=UPI001AE02B3C|nr:LysR family transcriptional regulator [Marinobacter salsuginis]QTN40786.1 LysR family transcriptional regulator [Marinobacter salsuginis]